MIDEESIGEPFRATRGDPESPLPLDGQGHASARRRAARRWATRWTSRQKEELVSDLKNGGRAWPPRGEPECHEAWSQVCIGSLALMAGLVGVFSHSRSALRPASGEESSETRVEGQAERLVP